MRTGIVEQRAVPLAWGRSLNARQRDRLWAFAAALVGLLVVAESAYLAFWVVGPMGWDFGQDYRFYREIGARFVADGSYYLPHQLAGSYSITVMVDVLYPPSALFLFVPFAVLPEPLSAVLWWAIPIAVTGYVIRWLRPKPWALLVIAVLMLYPRAIGAFLFGNTDLWGVAAIAGGLRWGWPAILLLLKPSFAPLSLIGARARSWWIGLIIVGLASLVLVPLWFDYVRAMTNMKMDLDYSLPSLALLLVPIIARIGSSRGHIEPPLHRAARPEGSDGHVERGAHASLV